MADTCHCPHRATRQVHTTGMDIKQALDATAACTLGKDMTLRDHAQGVYRMRGLGRGQTIVVLVVDEVRELILESVADPAARRAAEAEGIPLPNAWEDLDDRQPRVRAKKLEDVLAWLLLNSMRSEHLQHMQLCQQCLHNVWRKRAFARLLASEAPSEAGQGGDQIAARGGILATADADDDDEAIQEQVIPTESLLLTRFVAKPLDDKEQAERGVEDEIEALTAEETAALEMRSGQQFPEVHLKCDRGNAITSYSVMRGAFAACLEPSYMVAEGHVPMAQPQHVELKRGKWTWEISIDDMPPNLSGGELQVGIIDMRKPKTHDHGGFVFDFGAKETRVVPWSKSFRKGEQAKKHVDLEKGACLALMLDLPAADEKQEQFAMPAGVLTDLPANYLDSDWVKHYDEQYDHRTKDDSFDTIPAGATYIFVGARDPDGKIVVGAIGERSVVLQETSLNQPNEHNGLYWYFTKGKAFGFSPTDEIECSSADVHDKNNNQRLSWHLTGSGGYRAGSNCDLNSDKKYRKLVYWHEGGKTGKLSLLVRKDGQEKTRVVKFAETVGRIPLGTRYTPYVVWLPKATNTGAPPPQLNVMMHCSLVTMQITEKDPDFHPIESHQLSKKDQDARLARMSQLIRRQQKQQFSKVTLRRVLGDLQRVHTPDELKAPREIDGRPLSALLEPKVGAPQIKLVGRVRCIAVAGDQRPVRLRSGCWWLELGLDSLPANVSGQLRVGFMSDRLTESEAAGFAIDFGPNTKKQGNVVTLEWASGLKVSGKAPKQDTKLVCGKDHRIALALSFPESDSAAAALRNVPSWTGPGATFDDIEQRQRVVVADTELCEELFAREGFKWTESHNYFCGRTGRARTGHVQRTATSVPVGDLTEAMLKSVLAKRDIHLAVKESKTVRDDTPEGGKAREGHPYLELCRKHAIESVPAVELKPRGEATEYAMVCYVKLDTTADATAEGAEGSSSGAAADERGVLPFLTGCLLDAPDHQFKARSREHACLTLYIREGDTGTLVREITAPVYTIPGDNVPLKPFVEWGGERDEKEGITLSVHWYAAGFALRDNTQFLPIASDEMMRNEVLGQSRFAIVAAEQIKKQLLLRLQRRFVLNLYRKLQRKAEAQMMEGAEPPSIGRQTSLDQQTLTGLEHLRERKEAISAAALARIRERAEKLQKARDNVRRSIKKMMVRDKNGQLVPTAFGKSILRERRLAKGHVADSSVHASAVEKFGNVQQMLSGFENSRLTRGGFWDWEDQARLNASNLEADATAKAEEARRKASTDEMPSNQELFRAANLAASRGTVTVHSSRAELGDLSFASPPNMCEEEWLEKCVMLFREPLDLSLTDEVPKPQQYIEKLKGITKGHAIFIDDQLRGLDAVRMVLEEVSEGDRGGGEDKKSGRRTDFDSEMVQEQQQVQSLPTSRPLSMTFSHLLSRVYALSPDAGGGEAKGAGAGAAGSGRA